MKLTHVPGLSDALQSLHESLALADFLWCHVQKANPVLESTRVISVCGGVI